MYAIQTVDTHELLAVGKYGVPVAIESGEPIKFGTRALAEYAMSLVTEDFRPANKLSGRPLEVIAIQDQPEEPRHHADY